MSRGRWMVVVGCLLVIGLAWLMVWWARDGLVVRPLTHNGIPMRLIAPANTGPVPGVIIAHGFSGSQQLMLGFAYTLAHAGYATLLLDFDGHAANPAPLGREMTRGAAALQANMDAAYAALVAQPEVDDGRVALLGHSMGSGAVMTAGIINPERYQAAVAVSPTDAAVTETEPRNLLLQAGQLEPQFAANAEDLLARAGGANTDFANGRARSFQLIPGVEHITILFSPTAHQTAVGWLGQTFGLLTTAAYIDRRMVWYLVQLAAWLVLAAAITPAIRQPRITPYFRRPPWHVIGLFVAPLVATAVLWLANQIIPVGQLGGILIAGAQGLWFLIFGLVWLALGWRWRQSPISPSFGKLRTTLSISSSLRALAIFAFLWLAFGLMAQVVWLPWFLIPVRLLRWPLLALAFVPWLLAAGRAQQGASMGKRIGWWVGQSGVLMVGLGTAVLFVPSLFFLVLVLPVLPIVLGIMALVGGAVDDPWAYGLGNALFFAWLLLALFPLAG
ncbi:MAG: alpha/beta fold hydrolase [Chloroflexi bacterium]|nr:alpha/beta fold hydrolase [Ardenticatenaceae bacterium]MBL1128526.1 alpha/beta fold hydrolase [Chloroflexota bacterium]NOG34604.1 alpha/beta fold hydrolase [Chloroflexota bacterium]